MRNSGGGSIINVSSIAGMLGLSGSPGAVAYTATKAGLQGLTLSIAADYAARGIRANCLIVGSVWTPAAAAHFGEESCEPRWKAVPLQMEGTAWDVA
jgi:NAD(P)-dependent dehydrogenase (short-subunit alcohol dehydrogenase family)